MADELATHWKYWTFTGLHCPQCGNADLRRCQVDGAVKFRCHECNVGFVVTNPSYLRTKERRHGSRQDETPLVGGLADAERIGQPD